MAFNFPLFAFSVSCNCKKWMTHGRTLGDTLPCLRSLLLYDQVCRIYISSFGSVFDDMLT